MGETVWEIYFGVGNEGPKRVSLSLPTSHFTTRELTTANLYLKNRSANFTVLSNNKGRRFLISYMYQSAISNHRAHHSSISPICTFPSNPSKSLQVPAMQIQPAHHILINARVAPLECNLYSTSFVPSSIYTFSHTTRSPLDNSLMRGVLIILYASHYQKAK
jgi:hypothetical protein